MNNEYLLQLPITITFIIYINFRFIKVILKTTVLRINAVRFVWLSNSSRFGTSLVVITALVSLYTVHSNVELFTQV